MVARTPGEGCASSRRAVYPHHNRTRRGRGHRVLPGTLKRWGAAPPAFSWAAGPSTIEHQGGRVSRETSGVVWCSEPLRCPGRGAHSTRPRFSPNPHLHRHPSRRRESTPTPRAPPNRQRCNRRRTLRNTRAHRDRWTPLRLVLRDHRTHTEIGSPLRNPPRKSAAVAESSRPFHVKHR